MQNLLFHIDSRCIHGQIVAGWGFQEKIKRFLLANDAAAEDEWERKQYLDTPGADYETYVLGVEQAVSMLGRWLDGRKTMLIACAPRDALRILEMGLRHDLITIGNLEPGPDKQQLSPTVFISEQDRNDLRQIIKRDVQVVIKPLPDSKAIPLAPLLKAD